MSEETTFIPEPEEDDEDDGLLEMIDENGTVTTVRIEATIELDGRTYLALSEPPEDEDDEDAEVGVSFAELIDEDAEDPEEALRPVSDPALMDTLFARFIEMVEAEEEEE